MIKKETGFKGNVKNTDFIIDDLGGDELDLVEIALMVEQEFDISIPDKLTEDDKTVGVWLNFIHSKLNH